jgi:hypothetical protein
MHKTQRTPAGDALTNLVLDIFRLNTLILTAGDRLVAALGLTSARWQILGAIVAAERPPHHRRAQLVVLTDKGRRTFDAAMRLQVPWINNLSDGLSVEDVEAAHRVVTAVRKKFEGDVDAEEQA